MPRDPTAPVTLLGISQGAATCIRLRDPSSGTRRSDDPVWRLRPWRVRARDARTPGCSTKPWSIWCAWPGAKTIRRSVRCSRRGSFPAAATSSCSGSTISVSRRPLARSSATLLEARGVVDVTASLGRGARRRRSMLHARGDEVVPIAEGRLLASGIPGAEFVELDSRNHILLEHEPAWQRFCDAVLAFLQPGADAQAIRRSRRCRRVSVRCWRSWPRG